MPRRNPRYSRMYIATLILTTLASVVVIVATAAERVDASRSLRHTSPAPMRCT